MVNSRVSWVFLRAMSFKTIPLTAPVSTTIPMSRCAVAVMLEIVRPETVTSRSTVQLLFVMTPIIWNEATLEQQGAGSCAKIVELNPLLGADQELRHWVVVLTLTVIGWVMVAFAMLAVPRPLAGLGVTVSDPTERMQQLAAHAVVVPASRCIRFFSFRIFLSCLSHTVTPARYLHDRKEPVVELRLRPYATAGVALVGASVIAIAPVAPPLPDVYVANPAVQLSAAVDPITPWLNVFNDSVINFAGLADAWLEAPSPVLQQVIANQIGYLGELPDFEAIFGQMLTNLGNGVAAPFATDTSTLDPLHSLAFIFLKRGSPGLSTRCRPNFCRYSNSPRHRSAASCSAWWAR